MLKSFLNFDQFITPRVITVLYWIQIVGVVIIAFSVMFSGIGGGFYYTRNGGFYRSSFTFSSFLAGIFIFVVGVLMVRVMNELIIVLFRIQEHLKAIREEK